MVKGTSRQVILVHSPDKALFEQAIFILKDKAQPVTEEALLKEAEQALKSAAPPPGRSQKVWRAVWALGGAAVTGAVWLLTVLL